MTDEQRRQHRDYRPGHGADVESDPPTRNCGEHGHGGDRLEYQLAHVEGQLDWSLSPMHR